MFTLLPWGQGCGKIALEYAERIKDPPPKLDRSKEMLKDEPGGNRD